MLLVGDPVFLMCCAGAFQGSQGHSPFLATSVNILRKSTGRLSRSSVVGTATALSSIVSLRCSLLATVVDEVDVDDDGDVAVATAADSMIVFFLANFVKETLSSSVPFQFATVLSLCRYAQLRVTVDVVVQMCPFPRTRVRFGLFVPLIPLGLCYIQLCSTLSSKCRNISLLLPGFSISQSFSS